MTTPNPNQSEPANKAADAELTLEQRIVAALREIYDPEIPVNIYDLGLIYELDVNEERGEAHIKMTLTTPACPVAQSFPSTVERAVEAVPGINKATVELVWDPPWTQERMPEAARLQLGLW